MLIWIANLFIFSISIKSILYQLLQIVLKVIKYTVRINLYLISSLYEH